MLTRKLNSKRLDQFAQQIGQQVRREQIIENSYKSSIYLGDITDKYCCIAGRGSSAKEAERNLIEYVNTDKNLNSFIKKYLPKKNPLEIIKKLFIKNH